MTFPREFPLGVPVGTVLTSPTVESMDINISKSINGVDGDTVAGAVIFTGSTLGGSSTVNTTGDVTCDELTANGVANFNDDFFCVGDAAFGANCEISGILTVGDAIIVSGGTNRIETDRVIVNRVICTSPGTQSIDCSTGTVLALNFIADDTWVVTLSDSSDPTSCAILTTTCTLVDTNGTAHLQLKPGSKCSILFKAAAGQTGGIGLTPGIFPASFRGISDADMMGPRTGGATGFDGEEDWIRIDLVNIGTAAAPVYSCTLTMGGKV